MITKLELDEFTLSSKNVHYFASFCVPTTYKQQTHLLDTYCNGNDEISIVSRQCGTTTIQAIFTLWHLIFRPNQTIAFSTITASLCEDFVNAVIKINDNLPEHLKAKFTNSTRYTLSTNNNSRLIAKVTHPTSFRGLSVSTLIVDHFHFMKRKDLNNFLESTLPVLKSSRGKIILSTSINPNGFKLYEFLHDFTTNSNAGVSVVPFKKCSHYSELVDLRLKSYSSTEYYLAGYCCIDREGVNYDK